MVTRKTHRREKATVRIWAQIWAQTSALSGRVRWRKVRKRRRMYRSSKDRRGDPWPALRCNAESDIDRVSLARALTGSEDFATAVLPTGRYLNEIISATVVWLRNEGFTHNQGSTPWDSVSLSGKGFVPLNIVPPGFKGTLGEALHAAGFEGQENRLVRPGRPSRRFVRRIYKIYYRSLSGPVAMKRV